MWFPVAWLPADPENSLRFLNANPPRSSEGGFFSLGQSQNPDRPQFEVKALA